MKTSALIFSYYPLMPLLTTMPTPDELEVMLRNIPEVKIVACAWIDSSDKITPVLMMDNAAAVLDHLKLWSEGQPEEWFDIFFTEHLGMYGVFIFPRIEQSIERFRISQSLSSGVPIELSEIRLLFSPLWYFSGTTNSSFAKVKNNLPGTGQFLEIGFMDRKDYVPGSVEINDDIVQFISLKVGDTSQRWFSEYEASFWDDIDPVTAEKTAAANRQNLICPPKPTKIKVN